MGPGDYDTPPFTPAPSPSPCRGTHGLPLCARNPRRSQALVRAPLPPPSPPAPGRHLRPPPPRPAGAILCPGPAPPLPGNGGGSGGVPAAEIATGIAKAGRAPRQVDLGVTSGLCSREQPGRVCVSGSGAGRMERGRERGDAAGSGRGKGCRCHCVPF